MFSAEIRSDLVLRLVEAKHASAIFKLVDHDREDLRQWLPWVDGTVGESDTRAFIRASRRKFAAVGEITAGIWFQREFAGVIGMVNLSSFARRVEIGYWLGKAFRGRGIMTDACRAFVRHALVEMELNRVEIRCAPGNIRSRKIPQRLGFKHEATLREAELLDGTFHDLEVWSMLKRELKD